MRCRCRSLTPSNLCDTTATVNADPHPPELSTTLCTSDKCSACHRRFNRCCLTNAGMRMARNNMRSSLPHWRLPNAPSRQPLPPRQSPLLQSKSCWARVSVTKSAATIKMDHLFLVIVLTNCALIQHEWFDLYRIPRKHANPTRAQGCSTHCCGFARLRGIVITKTEKRNSIN